MDKTIVKEKVNDEAVMPETDTQVGIIKKPQHPHFLLDYGSG